MLKKYYLFFFFLAYSSCTYGSFWDDLGKCFSDPCNCGYNDIEEVWNQSGDKSHQLVKKIKPNPICPPWNKRDGRTTDNCLLQFNPPGNFLIIPYLTHCAERTSESSYFTPKIRIRTQSCNSFACWSQSTTLNWDGDCIIWPGAYALPLLRICARIAVPEIPANGINSATPADPGYSKGKHLNDVGYLEDDEKFYDENKNEIVFDRPKLCAYSDPGLVNLISDTGVHSDPLDWNPLNQALHKTNELHPITKILLFFMDTAGGASIAEMLSQLLTMTGAENIPGLDVLQVIIKAIGEVLNFSTTIVKFMLKTFGTLNGDVDDYKFGCVELPFGPMPPPYCPELGKFVTVPTTKAVCSKKDKNGFFVQNSAQPCVVSKLANNVINNVVRISLDNLVPVCRNGENPKDTDKCVIINGLSLQASVVHTSTAQSDVIKKCDPGNTGLCVNTKIPYDQNGQNEFRIVYAQKIGDRSRPTSYYVDDLPDCPSNNTTCQEVWGINIGRFVDVAVTFPQIQSQKPDDLLTLMADPVELKDNNGKTRNFVASIARNILVDTAFDPQLSRTPKDICVAEGSNLIGCEKRVTDGYKIVTYNCGQLADSRLACNKSSVVDLYYAPQFIASVEVSDNPAYYTRTVVTPLSVNTIPKPPVGQTEAIINLAGYNFSSFMAYINSSQYIAMPFSGAKSINPLTIYGEYKNDVNPAETAPYDQNGKPNNDAVYLTGIEYVNGQYIQGATHSCLAFKDTDKKCIPSVNDANCVLVNLLESNIVDCKTLKNKSIDPQYLNLRICNKFDTNCKSKESMTGIGGGITIYQCDNSVICYRNNNHPDIEVCKISMDSGNRVTPNSIWDYAKNPDEHYTTNPTEPDYTNTDPDKINDNTPKTSYDESKQAIRDKTSQELNLCNPIATPKCQAITNPSTSGSGNATWPETAIGKLALGTCPVGWSLIDSTKPLQRYCLSNAVNKIVEFEKLPAGVGCQENKGISFTYSINNPANIPHSETYDKSTKIGTLTLGDAKQGPLSLTLRCANYEFEIADLNQLEYFEIGENSLYDDYLSVKVNDNVVFAEPSNSSAGQCSISKMSCKDGSTNGANGSCVLQAPCPTNIKNLPDQGRQISVASKFDIKSKLIKGKNKISVCLGVVGGGSLRLNMKYKMK